VYFARFVWVFYGCLLVQIRFGDCFDSIASFASCCCFMWFVVVFVCLGAVAVF